MAAPVPLHDRTGKDRHMKIIAVIKLIWLAHHSNNVMKQLSIAAVAVAILMGTALTTTSVYAGTYWKDSCRAAGYDDGQNGPFSQGTRDHCGEEEGGDDAYYKGFIDGCKSVESNTRDVCESATD